MAKNLAHSAPTGRLSFFLCGSARDFLCVAVARARDPTVVNGLNAFSEEGVEGGEEHDGGGGEDDGEHVGDFQGADVEHRASDVNYRYLTDQNNGERREEDQTVAGVVKSRVAARESAGVEEVPELQEHKHCEEHRQVVGRQ